MSISHHTCSSLVSAIMLFIVATMLIWYLRVLVKSMYDTYRGDSNIQKVFILQCMRFDAPFVFPKFGPPENIQTKVYSGGIKSINITVNSHLKVIFVAATTGLLNQGISKFFVATIIPIPVCFTRIGTDYCRTEVQVVELVLVRLKTEHKGTHTVSGSQLLKDYA